MSTGLVLAAEDAADLEVISARLQDAVARLKDFVYLPKKRRFVAVFNRFQWEADEKRGDLRVQSGLHFDGVLSVKSHNLKQGAREAVVSLLALQFRPSGGEDCSGTIELTFAGGGAMRLEVECIDAGLTDISREWAARGRPEHEDG